MNNSIDIITNIIKSHVNMMNYAMKADEHEAFDRFRSETMGMLICLRNICDGDRFYCINIFDDRVEFGYYDVDHNWWVL